MSSPAAFPPARGLLAGRRFNDGAGPFFLAACGSSPRGAPAARIVNPPNDPSRYLSGLLPVVHMVGLCFVVGHHGSFRLRNAVEAVVSQAQQTKSGVRDAGISPREFGISFRARGAYPDVFLP